MNEVLGGTDHEHGDIRTDTEFPGWAFHASDVCLHLPPSRAQRPSRRPPIGRSDYRNRVREAKSAVGCAEGTKRSP